MFDINNDNDAEVSLQIANALTLSLLSYRMKMTPMLVGLSHFIETVFLLLALLLLFHCCGQITLKCLIGWLILVAHMSVLAK